MRHITWLLIITLAFAGFESSLCYAKSSQTSLDAALLSAVHDGNVKNVKTLLAQGASVNARDDDGRTPLMNASYVGETEWGFRPFTVVELLLAHGADVNAKDKSGGTALMTAAATNSMEAVAFLIARGATVDAKDNIGQTALMHAIYSEGEIFSANIGAIRYLLSHGANVNTTDKHGNTALMRTSRFLEDARAEAITITEMLLAKGADVNSRSKNGNTALKWAKTTGHAALIQMLKRAGAKS